ncbi:MAG TPA: AbrB/MazE/SpoVT family DNA-binding domain-containing protein [Caulobacter sp.]|nr:AbrB/MazE/SpoVT family DNA-binding domain-containing protein [Caulobacter sp.]
MQTSLRRIGNLTGVVLPKPFLASIGAGTGDAVDVTLEDGRIVIVAVGAARKKHPREGWAEEARAMAEAGLTEEEREWLEAPLSAEADAKLEW